MILSGRKVFILSSSLFALIFFPSLVNANESSASVVNKVNTSSSTSGGSTTGRTDIVIECNGVKKEYHSDKAENVELNCDDETSGTVKSQVNITNNTSVSPAGKITPQPTDKDDDENNGTSSGEVLGEKTKIREEREDLFEKITQFIRNLFKNFHF